MGPKPLTIRARIALMAALGLALLALGPMADAQTTAPISPAQNARSKSDGKAADSKDAYAKDTKSKDAKSKDAKKDAKSKDKSSKDAKSKDAKSKDTKSKDAKSKDSESKNAKDAKSDPKAGKTASRSSETTVPYSGPASAEDVARVKTAVGLARQGKSSQATDEQRAISDPAARKLVEWAILRSDKTTPIFPATLPSSPPIRAGQRSVHYAGAPKRCCGSRTWNPRRCGPSLPRTRR